MDMTNLPKTKVCTKCGKRKALDKYTKMSTGKYGRHPECKTCKRERDRSYGSLNKDRLNAYAREYAKTHRVEDRARHLKMRLMRPEHCKRKAIETSARYRKRNPNKISQYTKRNIENGYASTMASLARSGLKKSDVPKELFQAMQLQSQIKRYLKENCK